VGHGKFRQRAAQAVGRRRVAADQRRARASEFERFAVKRTDVEVDHLAERRAGHERDDARRGRERGRGRSRLRGRRRVGRSGGRGRGRYRRRRRGRWERCVCCGRRNRVGHRRRRRHPGVGCGRRHRGVGRCAGRG
jgi:hypothetical protein